MGPLEEKGTLYFQSFQSLLRGYQKGERRNIQNEKMSESENTKFNIK